LYEDHGFSRAVEIHSCEGFFPNLCLHGITAKNRTSAAKAAPAQHIYGTAEAVPFVQSVFPQHVSGCGKMAIWSGRRPSADEAGFIAKYLRAA
jgi:hypothetical protein